MISNSVNLILRADTSGFSDSIRQAEQEFTSRFKRMGSTATSQSNGINDNFKSMSEGISSFSSQIKKAAKQLSLMAGAVTGIGLLGKHMIGVADHMTIAADRVGITTDLLQELRFAASLTGVETEKLDSAISKFTRQIGKAASGTGPAADLFEKLGVAVHGSDGILRDSEAILKDVADALSQMGTQAERAAVTTSLFGKEGIALNLLLGKGAESIEAFQKQARELGIVVDEKLLRSSEKANVQLHILSTIVKSQIITAFSQLTPHLIDFSNKIVAALPKIKEIFSKFSDLKDVLIYLSKVFVAVKIAQFATGLLKASKIFVTTTTAASLFTQSLGVLSKALSSIGMGVALVSAIEALSLLKQHLDFRSDVKKHVQSQHTLMDVTSQFAHVARLSQEDFAKLSEVEKETYKTRLFEAQKYWQAALTLESREDFQSQAALYAAKENRLYFENIQMLEKINNLKIDLLKNHTSAVNKIRADETNVLKRNIGEQLEVYDKALTHLQLLKEKRKSLAKDFQTLINNLQSAPTKPQGELDVLDIHAQQNIARNALAGNDIERAYSAVQKIKEIIEVLHGSGAATPAYLAEQAKVTANIADQIAASEIEAHENSIALINDTITSLKAKVEFLKHLTVEFDEQGAVKSADEIRKIIQERLINNPIKIPTVVIQDSPHAGRVEKILKPEQRARGGFISGPGTSMSDSIFARLSNGEFVVRASAVRHYGLGVFNQLNQMKLPKYARGGLVPPSVPLMKASVPSSGQAASLTLNLGGKPYNIKTHDVDVIEGLSKAVAREALKSGRLL